jgi:hypothetical protein
MYMDSDLMDERAREILYGIDQTIVTARDLESKLDKKATQ